MTKFGKIMKTVMTVLLFTVIGALILRIFFADARYVLKNITPTENAVSAYASTEGGGFLTNSMDDSISGNSTGADGLFSAYAFVYLPESGEVQVTVRMNKSTLAKLETDAIPRFFLKNYASEEVFDSVSFEDESDALYLYRRLVFENVKFSENEDLILCLAEGPANTSLSELVLHFREQKFKEYKLSSKEIKLLENGGNEQ